MSGLSIHSRRFVAAVIICGLALMLASAVHTTRDKAAEVFSGKQNAPASPSAKETSEAGERMSAFSPEQTEELMDLMQQVKADPTDAKALVRIAELFFEAEDWAVAQTFLNRAVMSSPEDAYPRYMLGMALFRQGKSGEAAVVFEELLDIHEDPAALYNLALLYKYHLNKPVAAKELLQKALAFPDLDKTLEERLRKELHEQ